MNKEELITELKSANEQLKNNNKLLDLLRDEDDPAGILARLRRTVGRIEMLLLASDAKELAHPKNSAIQKSTFHQSGILVSIRPCAEEYGDKTYLGILIGDIALGSSITLAEDKVQLNFSGHNPAIFVPELRKVIYGCESWWAEIESEEQLRKITNDDIQNAWYMKMLNKTQENTSDTPNN